jgi:hypothetical protein
MEHSKEAGQIAPDMLVIGSELFDGFGRGFEKSRVDEPLVSSDKTAQAFGNREGEHEVMAGKLPVDLAFEPISGLAVLTGGAMAIAAGAINEVAMSTLLTLIEGDPGLLGAALENGIHGFAVLLWQAVAKALDIFGAEGPEDVIEVFHIKALP